MSTQHLLTSTATKLHICCSSVTPVLLKPTSHYINIYIMYTPNLGFEIVFFDEEKEQSCFRGSTKGAKWSIGEYRRAESGHEEAKSDQ